MRDGFTETDISALDACGRRIDAIATTLAVITTNRDFVMFLLLDGEPPDVIFMSSHASTAVRYRAVTARSDIGQAS